MGPTRARRLTLAARNAAGTVAALTGALMLGACAQTGNELQLGSLNEAKPSASTAAARSPSTAKTPADYLARKYAESPTDLNAALDYARHLKASGRKKQAYDVLQQVAIFHPTDKTLASEYGRLALEFDQVSLAKKLLEAADDPSKPDWKVLSARGTVLAKQEQYGEAIAFYQRALALAPDQPSVMSNLALAYAMTGNAAKAEPLLRRAVAIDGGTPRTRQNLALIVGLQGKYDDAQRIAMGDIGAERAAANADYLRRMVKLDGKRPVAKTASTDVANAAPAPRLKPTTAETGSGSDPVIGSWTSEVAQRTDTR